MERLKREIKRKRNKHLHNLLAVFLNGLILVSNMASKQILSELADALSTN